MSLYARIADLPLRIEGYALEGLALDVGSWVRKTTVVRLRGGGHEGVGEDITWVPGDQEAFQEQCGELALGGETTVDGFSRLLDRARLFPRPPQNAEPPLYRRWAFESAALDLALRQAGQSLAEALGRELRPLTFVVSRGLGEPARFEKAQEVLERYPGTRFKLDLSPSWTDELMARLAETGAVACVDFKGHYHGTFTGPEPDADLYRRAAAAFPEAWIEDPFLDDATGPVLKGEHGRITYDAPIHALSDILQLPLEPRCMNIKPSRFGFLSELLRTYEYCEGRGIAMYGGGQHELGPGRGQAQYLASLFHPDGANDLAPSAYNAAELQDGLPTSPLPAPSAAPGFRWEA